MLAGMGTELECSQNFFTTLPRSHGNPVTISFDTLDTWAPSKDRPLKTKAPTGSAFDPPQQPMEGLERHRESLRMTMLEHEKIFKEQVRELHRLYRTQKLMMSQLQNRELKLHPLPCATPAAQASSSPSTSKKHRHSDQNSHLGHRTKASLSSQELTICSDDSLRAQSGGFAHQPPSAGDATQAQDRKLRVGTAPSCSDEECDLELTLSIGCSGSKKRTGSPSHSDTPSGGRPASSANSTRYRTPSAPARSDPGGRAEPTVERLQRPAWLFQGLNRT